MNIIYHRTIGVKAHHPPDHSTPKTQWLGMNGREAKSAQSISRWAHLNIKNKRFFKYQSPGTPVRHVGHFVGHPDSSIADLAEVFPALDFVDSHRASGPHFAADRINDEAIDPLPNVRGESHGLAPSLAVLITKIVGFDLLE